MQQAAQEEEEVIRGKRRGEEYRIAAHGESLPKKKKEKKPNAGEQEEQSTPHVHIVGWRELYLSCSARLVGSYSMTDVKMQRGHVSCVRKSMLW